jgi:hypothetical protein
MGRDWARALLAFWLLCFAAVVQAQTFFQVLVGTDYASLISAALTAIIASVIRTTLTLVSPDTVTVKVLRQALRDVVFAFFAGGAAHLLVEVVRVVWWPAMPPILRLSLILLAGASRSNFFGWLERLTNTFGDAVVERLSSIVKRGGA